jgi:hypothetical protein
VYGFNEVDVTNLQSRGWMERVAGTLWCSDGGDQPGIEEKLAQQSHLVLRLTIDDATSAEALVGGMDLNAIADWLSSVGARDATALAIFRCGNQYSLHLTELAPDRPVDYATGLAVTAPRVVDLGTDASWPDCLNLAGFAPKRLEFIHGPREPIAA